MDAILNRLPGPRILVGAAALLLVLAYFTPLWTIRLVAPQYPDGMGMYIGISEVRGHDTHDLQNINILNHYIGMQEIQPEAIPELEIMPVILGILIGAGLLVAIIGHRWLLAGWLAAFLVAGTAGMVDFYMWKYDYGHNLSPDAPIKVPGMTYQPPLIGTKQLLNITASSYPYWGTLVISLSGLLGFLGVWKAFRRDGRGELAAMKGPGDREGPDGASRPEDAGTTAEGEEAPTDAPAPGRTGPVRAESGITTGALALAALLLTGCGAADGNAEADRSLQRPDRSDAIVYGEDVDPFCGREVEAVRYGAEIRTTGGERFRFRSVECAAGFLLSERIARDEVRAVKVVDFADGWRLLDASEAIYLHTANLPSPDRLNLSALDPENERIVRNLHDAYAGSLIGWDEVLELVGREWGTAVARGGCEVPEARRAPPVCT